MIPLSQRSGVLEWCEGTIPLGEYLVGGTDNAHARYRPQDMKPMDCRREMQAAIERAKTESGPVKYKVRAARMYEL